MEIAVKTHLAANPAVSALVGTRIYPLALPQNVTYPAIRYQLIDTPRIYTKDGYSGDSRPRLQIDCWALTYLGAKQLAATVRTAMEGYLYAICVDEQEGYEQDPLPPVYRRILDFQVWHKE